MGTNLLVASRRCQGGDIRFDFYHLLGSYGVGLEAAEFSHGSATSSYYIQYQKGSSSERISHFPQLCSSELTWRRYVSLLYTLLLECGFGWQILYG